MGIANKWLTVAWNRDNLRRRGLEANSRRRHSGLGTPRNQNILAVWIQASRKLELSLEASEGNSFNETALGKEEG